MLLVKKGMVTTGINRKLDTLNYDTIKIKRKSKEETQKYLLNLICSFDIETTSYIDEVGNKSAWLYEWTFAIEDITFYGRTFEDYQYFIEYITQYFGINKNKNLIVYVHNLGYEFQFMRKYFDWNDVFSLDIRKPIKAETTEGIIYKCSYILSGMSLERTAKNLISHKIEKLGDFDYKLIRTPVTVLNEQELKYCEIDVLIIIYYIREQREQYGCLTKIPLTNTGRVRRYVRDKCFFTDSENHEKSSKGKYQRYSKVMKNLKLTSKEYTMLKMGFQGGFTHSNYRNTNKVIKNVCSIDFTSSYPAVMLSEKFPMGKGVETSLEKEGIKDIRELFSKYCVLAGVTFTNLRPNKNFDSEQYLSVSKCKNIKNVVENNGRVFTADRVSTILTDCDIEIMYRCYEWDSMEIGIIYKYIKSYLPKPILQSVIDLYKDKTELKDVAGKEVEYLNSKGMLNSIYGMCVTDIVRDNILYSENWEHEKNDLNEQIEIYNDSKMRFISYAWGVWVTAYARRNLWLNIVNMGDDYIYSDTDSIKFKNYKKYDTLIEKYNEMVIKKLKNMCIINNINFEDLKPKNIKGVEKMIGIWDCEGVYTRFKTLGAKRYIVEKDDKLEITVAGLGKKKGVDYMKRVSKGNNTKVFKMFCDDLYIPANETGKMTHTYLDEDFSDIIEDYQGNLCKVNSKSGIHLGECEFTLSLSRQYSNFLNRLINGEIYRGEDFNGE